MSREQLELLAKLLERKKELIKYNKLSYMFPDEDMHNYPFSKDGLVHARYKYPKQIEFFKAGQTYTFRKMLAPNRSGKSFCGGFEFVCHATGNYPSWWEGKRFNRPLKMWVGGVDAKSLREGAQTILLGSQADMGAGLFPKDSIHTSRSKAGIDGAVDTLYIHYKDSTKENPKLTVITFKSYEEKISSWAAANIDVIWLDEEPDLKLYDECVPRIIESQGVLYSTMTPDKGLTETILKWFPDGVVKNGPISTDSYCISFDMDDVPHLSAADKKKMYDELTPYAREAKYYGRPNAGAGLIYPIHPEDITFKITSQLPDPLWPRGYGMDPGNVRTAVVWAAYCKANDTIYIYDEYCRGMENASIHASAIKARGEWMYGIIDKAAKQSSQVSNENVLNVYTNLGLNLILSPAGPNTVEPRISDFWNRLSTGRMKIAENCQHVLNEIRTYRRDEKGDIVSTRGKDGSGHDTLDAAGYIVYSYESVMTVEPDLYDKPEARSFSGRDSTGGY